MRFLFFALILLWTSCTGQQNNAELTPIDTLKLFDPKPEKIEVNFEAFDIYKNCIAIKKDFYVAVINEIQNRFDTDSELLSFVETNFPEISKRKFYVLYDSSIDFKKIVSVLELLKSKSVDNYRVINLDTFFNIPPPAEIKPPTSVSSKIDKADSTNFIITIFDKSIQVKHLNKITTFSNASGLDKYIVSHKADIDSTKILVESKYTTSYTSFKPVKEVLKKHKYFVFKIIVNNENE